MDDGVSETNLAAVRLKIDRVDRQLVRMLAARKVLVETAARIKRFPRYVVDADRNEAVLENVRRCAREFGLPEAFAERVWRYQTELWIRHQLDLMVRESGEIPYAGNRPASHERGVRPG
ncbi:chorismate mutase [uncultured Maricaulis sp.]|uniref:chorismate mutase n=1 Tax=uncultured Maricaulis sp. TaxID=174710 RepID=UPI0030DD7FD6|tara:strand:+ start:154442 stop:154798 length:357 start_codon:yes stop_codon:yes gene_type:complete